MNTNKLQLNSLNQNESNVKINSPQNLRNTVYQQNKIQPKSLTDSCLISSESKPLGEKSESSEPSSKIPDDGSHEGIVCVVFPEIGNNWGPLSVIIDKTQSKCAKSNSNNKRTKITKELNEFI